MRKTAHELIEEIGSIIQNVWGLSEDPENLSKALNDISVKHYGLAVWKAEFQEQERLMKGEIDIEKANIILRLVKAGASVAKAEQEAKVSLKEKLETYWHMAAQLDKVDTMMKADEKVMDAVRSRLSLIKTELGGQT